MQQTPDGAMYSRELAKTPTGIPGLDEITSGGLPRGRPTLVCGGAGSGKTLLATSFLVNGTQRYGEPGVLMTFEENSDELASDVASLGFERPALVDDGKLFVDYVRIERSEIEETGEYDLEGLFVRIDHAVRSVGARRVVLDTIESLFSGLGKSQPGGPLRGCGLPHSNRIYEFSLADRGLRVSGSEPERVGRTASGG